MKIVGFKKFVSQKGTAVCAISVEQEFSENEKNASLAVKGCKAFTVMAYGNEGDLIKDDSIGKDLNGFFQYGKNGMSVNNVVVK